MAASLIRCAFGAPASNLLKFLRPSVAVVTECRRGRKNYLRKYLLALYKRRLEVGPEKPRHRSEWINWNYDAELYAFGKRLGEEFSPNTLRTAFTHHSYIEKEEKRRADVGIDTNAAPLGLTDNTDLIQKGEATASRYLKAYLRHIYPALYEEGIMSIHAYLMSEKMLAYIASHIGISDLILCADFPPEESTLSKTFLAVVGALETDQDLARAEAFVHDLVLTQLIGEDLTEIWKVTDPMGLLAATLHAQGRGLPEVRLLWQAGKRTVMSASYVGIYSDRHLIGQSFGETPTIAEEMAASDALRRLMGITNARPPLQFQSAAKKLQLDYHKINVHAEDIIREYEESQTNQPVLA
ncbi:hypothetical protein C0Q70_18632 [Pomacea canaliculata]|uniref:Large ribosomal subunit protein mL44 n=1 Tax=Pomacea canaliculata TaxID=400727 RepID=A0A2T7NH43_POMCA|nr:39S ribosomal protein L44, mitochondrial-like [Pomacea canaliculata]PVD20476.1 hypothetical protein C0Q70_18632 [Pomacea canaliculata]